MKLILWPTLGHNERVWSISWNPTGTLLASCSSDKTISWFINVKWYDSVTICDVIMNIELDSWFRYVALIHKLFKVPWQLPTSEYGARKVTSGYVRPFSMIVTREQFAQVHWACQLQFTYRTTLSPDCPMTCSGLVSVWQHVSSGKFWRNCLRLG